MSALERYDDIILGGGKGGKSLAMALGPAGHKVAMIERGQIGGTCINVACIPTKTMVASTKVLENARRAHRYGLNLGIKSPSLTAVLARKRSVVEGMVATHWDLFKNTENLDFILGTARFVDEKTIEIELPDGKSRRLTAHRIFINTGSKTQVPPTPGLAEAGYLTSTTIMELDTLPDHLIIIGGGYISLEFAQIFCRLGSRVTILERSGRFLRREDEDIAATVKEILEDEGIRIVMNAEVASVARHGKNSVVLNLQTTAGQTQIEGSHLLVAVGRVSNNEGLNLQAAGVATDARGYIQVNERLETSVPGIWAIGDCNGGPHFTHVSWDDFRIIRDNLLHGTNRTTTGRIVPYTLFIDPELGRVGMTEEEAHAKGHTVRIAKLPAVKVPRANTSGETRGLLKAVVDAKTKQILGCAIFAHEGGEVMSVVQVAMLAGLPYTALRDAIFTHPTMAESLNLLFATLG